MTGMPENQLIDSDLLDLLDPSFHDLVVERTRAAGPDFRMKTIFLTQTPNIYQDGAPMATVPLRCDLLGVRIPGGGSYLLVVILSLQIIHPLLKDLGNESIGKGDNANSAGEKKAMM